MITKQALGNILFGMADILRDKVEDYKSYILSLLFFKRLSDNYKWEIENGIEEFKKEFGVEPNQKQLQKIIADKHDFIIPDNCFWEDIEKTTLEKKNDALNKAVQAIADANAMLKGVINTVRWNEPSPDGSGGKKLSPVVLSSLISYLDPVDLSNKNTSVDILGDAYEYLIKKFADENKGGTTAGQFYTPQEVVDVIVRYLKPERGNTAYDPTCGSGGFLINAAKYIKNSTGSQKNIRLYGQEDVWNTWAIANINMILHGLDASIKKEDTLINPQFTNEDNELEVKTFDLVMANFPFSQENWWKNGAPKKDKKGKAVLKKDGSPQLDYPGKEDFKDPYDRFDYGIPPFSNGDFAFLQHIIASMNETGKAGVVCPQGVLFRGQPEKTEEEDGQNRKADDEYIIRRGLLQGPVDENGQFSQGVNIIDAIVFLPGNLFYGTTIPGAIIFFNKNKPEERKDKVLMVYAAREGWYKEEPNMNVLLPQDVLRISTILESWGDIEVAKQWIAVQKSRLTIQIQEELDFKKTEIDIEFSEELKTAEDRLINAQDKIKAKEDAGRKPTKTEISNLQKAEDAFKKLISQKVNLINEAEILTKSKLIAIDDVENELMNMFQTPELRQRYFSIVNMEELEENEFNLNIPRYVDTFEPEDEIDLTDAINGLKDTLENELKLNMELSKMLEAIQ